MLIKCPECGKEISDKAAMCPNCGCPSSEFEIKEQEEEKTKNVCPHCLSEAIDDDGYCGNCGMKICDATRIKENIDENLVLNENRQTPDQPYTICPNCGSYNITGVFTCEKCRYRYNSDEYKVILPWEEEKDSILYIGGKKANIPEKTIEKTIQKKPFNGIYRYGLFGGKTEVYCPRCRSENCSYFHQQKIIPSETKTRYTMNLNPLKPFTLVNKKEKVVKKEKVMEQIKIICNDCGNIFS